MKMNKYRATRVKNDLGAYDSKLEANYRKFVLDPKLKSGEISDLWEHKAYSIFPNIKWKVDFSYIENGVRVYDEVKGAETEGYRLKKNIWKACGPGELRIIKGIGLKFKVTEVIIPKDYYLVDFQNERVIF